MNRKSSGRIVRRGLVLVAGLALSSAAAAQQTPAYGEIPVDGTVAGSYLDTWSGDGIYEAIQEVESGGKPSKRTSLLEHKWTFDVPAGTSVALYLRAHHGANAEGDDFVFAWSTDEGTWSDLLTVTKTSDDGTYQSADLPAGISGLVYVRALDTDRTQGHRELDALFVDHLYIESSQGSAPPAAPSDLAARITEAAGYDGLELTWTDNSTNEDGFAIERSLDGVSWMPLTTVGSNVTSFLDIGLLPETTYSYVVRAFNGFGDSLWSEVATATTLPVIPFTVEQVTDVGAGPKQLAFDPAGRPCLVYDLWGVVTFVQWDGVSWVSEVVGPCRSGEALSFELSPDGRPALAYQGDGLEVRFSERRATGWHTEVVDPVWPQADRVSLAYDLDGNPAIAYRNAGNSAKRRELRLARRVGGEWSVEAVETRMAMAPKWKSLAFDPLGNPAVAYEGRADGIRCLKFAHHNGSTWDIEVVESGPDFGYGTRLAYDPTTGWPLMLHAGENPHWWELRLVRWDGSAWQTEVVVADGASFLPSRLEVTAAGVPYFAYRRYGQPPEHGLWAVHREAASWVHELVRVWHVVGDPAFALDADEQPAVLWNTGEALNLASK